MGREGPTALPSHSPNLNLDLYLRGHLKFLVYAAHVDNKESLYHRTVDVCQTIRKYAGTFERMRRFMMRRVEGCIESHEELFEHLL
jgi:hypothetical protein